MQFKVEDPSPVALIIVNMLGQHVKTVIKDGLYAGEYKLSWDGTDHNGEELPSGVYFAMLEVMDGIEVQKIILLK